MGGTVIFLNGPSGVGKTTLGRLAASRLGASFIDCDDLGDPSKRWFERVLTDSRALVRAGMAALREGLVVLIAKPLRARDWVYFKRRFEAEVVAIHCITLAARSESILGSGRSRKFSAEEQARIREMVAQGYADRPFSDAIVETDRVSLAETADSLVSLCRGLVASQISD